MCKENCDTCIEDKSCCNGVYRPLRCIDPVIKYCQECRYGFVEYPDWVETYEDTLDCCFHSGCIYGLENTIPTPDEIHEFELMCEKLEE